MENWNWKGIRRESLIGRIKRKVRTFLRKRENVAVLIDVENLIRATEQSDPEMKGIGRLLEYLAFQEKKNIICLQVYTSSHLTNKAKDLLYKIHDAEIVFGPTQMKPCPRNHISRFGKVKDVDSVDRQIIDYGEWLVNYVPSLAEIVVVSNDGDFRKLKSYATSHGVRYSFMAVSNKLAGDTCEVFDEKQIRKDFVTGG